MAEAPITFNCVTWVTNENSLSHNVGRQAKHRRASWHTICIERRLYTGLRPKSQEGAMSQDPKEGGAQPPMPDQKLQPPGLEAEMQLQPDYG